MGLIKIQRPSDTPLRGWWQSIKWIGTKPNAFRSIPNGIWNGCPRNGTERGTRPPFLWSPAFRFDFFQILDSNFF